LLPPPGSDPLLPQAAANSAATTATNGITPRTRGTNMQPPGVVLYMPYID
jgi:hypothetical protein